MSQVVNTSWAVLTLLQAKYPDPEPIRRGCKLIMSRQLRDGSWAQESIEGGTLASLPFYLHVGTCAKTNCVVGIVFNHAVAISCTLLEASNAVAGGARLGWSLIFFVDADWNFKHSWTIWALGKAARVLGRDGWTD